jgi:subtilisin family serine protease
MRWRVGGLWLRGCVFVCFAATVFFGAVRAAQPQDWVYPGALISVRGPSSARATAAEGLRESAPKDLRVEKLKRSPLRSQEHPIILVEERRIRGHARHQPSIVSNPTRTACRRAKMRKFLAGITGRVSCSANHALFPSRVPNDTFYTQLYSPNPMSLPAAWDLTTGSDTTLAAVIDTGILYSHPDLVDNLWTNPGEVAGDGIDNDGNGYIDDIHGWNAITNSGNANDDQGHGTHCAGIMGARGNNSRGIPGVAWNTKLIAVKFLSATGSGSTADAIKGINYLTTLRQRGHSVVLSNNSWGGGGFNVALQTAIQNHAQAGILFVAAAGNDNSNNDAVPKYPASYTVANILSVASTDSANQRSSFSNYGIVSVDIAAPGSGIYSTYLSNSYVFMNGTSMAAPQVSGIAILMQAACNNTLTYQQVLDGILSTGTVHTHLAGVVKTSAIAHAQRAVNWAIATCSSSTPPPTQTHTPTPTSTNTPTVTPTRTPTPTATPTRTPTNTPIFSPTPTPTVVPAPPRTCPNVKLCRSRSCTENALRCLSQLTPTPTHTPDDSSSGPTPTATATPTATPAQSAIRRPCCLGCRSRKCTESCSFEFCPGAPATATPTPTRETTATPTRTPTPTEIPRSTPPWTEDVSVPLMIFTSSINFSFTTAYNGVTGGLEAAREFCQQRADTAGIGGPDRQWYPLVSDSAYDAQSLTGISRSSAPIFDRIGGVIADSRGQLWDSSVDLLKPIDFDEFGAIKHSAAIMTGSTAEGIRYSSNPRDFCLDWTTHSSAEYFQNTGVSNEVDTDWFAEIDRNLCTWTRPVYCIGPASNATATPTPGNTATPTPTATPANTGTPTSTPTETPSPTRTPTATETPTTTPTPTYTPTSTETPTRTPTNTATPTPTPTFTDTPLPPPTLTATPTATPTSDGRTCCSRCRSRTCNRWCNPMC